MEASHIGRQKFLAELRKLLSGMTERDREAAMAAFTARFDEAQDEDALIAELISPTAAAISVLRGYKPSEESADEPEAPALAQSDDNDIPEAADEQSPAAAETETGDAPAVSEAPEALELLPDEEPGLVHPTEAPEEPALLDPEDFPDIEAVLTESEVEQPEPEPESAPEEVSPETPEEPEAEIPEKPRANGGRMFLSIVSGVLIGLPVTAALAALALAILAAGAALVSCGVFVVSLGFTGITVFADVMLITGAGLCIAALGLPVVFLAVWFFIRCAAGFAGLLLRTYKKWCFAERTVTEE